MARPSYGSVHMQVFRRLRQASSIFLAKCFPFLFRSSTNLVKTYRQVFSVPLPLVRNSCHFLDGGFFRSIANFMFFVLGYTIIMFNSMFRQVLCWKTDRKIMANNIQTIPNPSCNVSSEISPDTMTYRQTYRQAL